MISRGTLLCLATLVGNHCSTSPKFENLFLCPNMNEADWIKSNMNNKHIGCMFPLTLPPLMTGISMWRRLNSAIETVTETWRSVRQVSLVGMNSSNLEISSGVTGQQLSSTISADITNSQTHTSNNNTNQQMLQFLFFLSKRQVNFCRFQFCPSFFLNTWGFLNNNNNNND